MNAQTVIGIACLAIMSSGCVMKSTYDASVRESESLKTELERATEEQRLYARQVKELEQSNKDIMQDAEATLTATMRAQTDMESERRIAEEQQAKLKQKIGQLIRQHHAMREEMAVARENGLALQELVEVYKKKIAELARDNVASSAPNTTLASKPFDPALLPPVQDLPPPAPAVEPSKPAPAPATPPVPAKHKPEPAESGWLATIKEWVVSLWRSIFS